MLRFGVIGVLVWATAVQCWAWSARVSSPDVFNAAGGVAGWKPCNGSPAVAAEGGATRFPCPFRDDVERVYWDRAIALDLKHVALLELDVTCARPDATRTVGLYLKSGTGWYLWLTSLKEGGRQTILLPVSEASVEGSPTGWNDISSVRFSVTRGLPVTTSVTVHALRVKTCEVAIVRGTESIAEPSERTASRNAAIRIGRWLADAGVGYLTLDDEAVGAGGLRSVRVAILPYNPNPPRREMKALSTFVENGGKLIVCYAEDFELARLMDVRVGDYQVQKQPGNWSSFTFNRQAPANSPETVYQESSNIRPASPASDATKVIAYWNDAAGRALSDPAWVRSPNGYWMSHILQDEDDDAKQAMLVAMLGSLSPNVWREAADRMVVSAGKVAAFTDYRDSLDEISRLAKNSAGGTGVDALLEKAEQHHTRMVGSYSQKRYADAVTAGRALNACLVKAYGQVQRPRTGEFRGVWNHSGMGLYPGNWKRSCQIMAGAGLTAVFPNVLWAGTAHYKSSVVPVSDIGRLYGDQLAACVAAARPYGIDVHVWKVCWNLGRTSASFTSDLRRAGRLQQSDTGETIPWLCPSDPDNVALELAAIREVARYPGIAGVHLDYIRYPDVHACFCPGCRRRFEQSIDQKVRGWPESARTGVMSADYTRWRTAQITRFVQRAHETVKSVNSDLKLSAAVYRSYPDCAVSIGQDWGAWLKAGIIDFVCPMDYTSDTAAFASVIQRQLKLPGAKGRIYPGLGVTALESRLSPDRVIEQVLRIREAGGQGFMLFELNRTLEKETLPILATGLTRPEK